MALAPFVAEGKTINWADDKDTPGDVETTLRPTTFNRTIDSLFITSSLNNNVINIQSGSIGGAVFGALSGDDTDAVGNTINIYGGIIGSNGVSGSNTTGDVIAGYSRLGTAINNTVNMYDGTVKRDIHGGMSYEGDGAQYNTVNISGGTVEGGVYGGYVSHINGGGNATNNTVNITGGTIKGDIYGGDSARGEDQYNTVNISGNVSIAATATITGGNSGLAGNINSIRGNTLNMDWAGTIRTLSNFEYLNFVVSDAVVANGNTILNITGNASINYSHIKISAFTGAYKWSVGDEITVLSKSNGNSTLFGGSAQAGLTHKFDYDMVYDGTPNHAVLVNITAYGVNEDAGDLPSGGAGSNEFLKGTADLIDSADLVEEIDGLSRLIGVVRHSRSKIGSSSTVDVNGTAMLVGASRKYQGNGGYIMLGGFVEAGWGSYNTHSNFSSDSEINSNGKTNYHGLGIAARNIRDNGVYTAATVRLGRTFTKHKSANLADTSGNLANYDTNSMYYGINIGVGKVLNLSATNKLDVYGKYLFLHQGGSDMTILGDQVTLNSINSHRLRAGAKLKHQANNNLDTYLDLAYEYEFSGKATATAAGDMLPYISVKGGTAIADMGLVYKPKTAKNFEAKLGLQGYVGKRQGYATNLNLVWKF